MSQDLQQPADLNICELWVVCITLSWQLDGELTSALINAGDVGGKAAGEMKKGKCKQNEQGGHAVQLHLTPPQIL